MNEKIVKLINEQIEKEFESAYLYLSFANFYETKGLLGFANWFKVQAKEEQDHAMKFYQFLHDTNSNVKLLPIEAPIADIENLEDPLRESLSHEEYVTSLIYKIYLEAESHEDFRTMQFLFWFVEEQKEEENEARSMLEKYNCFGSTSEGLYMLDKEFAERKYIKQC